MSEKGGDIIIKPRRELLNILDQVENPNGNRSQEEPKDSGSFKDFDYQAALRNARQHRSDRDPWKSDLKEIPRIPDGQRVTDWKKR